MIFMSALACRSVINSTWPIESEREMYVFNLNVNLVVPHTHTACVSWLGAINRLLNSEN